VEIRVGSRTDVGRVRDHNEDSLLVRPPLFAVADGMGGHAGGEVASAMALEVLGGRQTESDQPPSLAELFRRANQEVLQRGRRVTARMGMGTTLTALLIEANRAHIVHVGDSRVYLFRRGSLKQVTEDDSLVQQIVRAGGLTKEEAERHPSRSVLTRVIGVEEDVRTQERTIDLHGADRLLLCTDGLTVAVDDDALLAILRRVADPQAACDELVEAANRAGGEDNITVILLDVDSGGGGADPSSPTN